MPSEHCSAACTPDSSSPISTPVSGLHRRSTTSLSSATTPPVPSIDHAAVTVSAAVYSLREPVMDEQTVSAAGERQDPEEPAATLSSTSTKAEQVEHVESPAAAVAVPATTRLKKKSKNKSTCCKASHHHNSNNNNNNNSSNSKAGMKAKATKEEDSSDSSSDSDSDDSSSSSSESDAPRRKGKKTKPGKSKKIKSAKRRSRRRDVTSDEESSSSASDAESESSESSARSEPKRKQKKKKKSSKKSKRVADRSPSPTRSSASESGESDESDDEDSDVVDLKRQLAEAELKAKKRKSRRRRQRRTESSSKHDRTSEKSHSRRKSDALQYRRVDELWDKTIHNFKLKESAEAEEDEFAEFAFLVRRTFDLNNKYYGTVVDIKSKQLRLALVEIMKDCKSVSLEAEEPTIDPNTLFLYLEQLRTHYKKTLKARIKAQRKRKVIRRLEQQRALLKLLVAYIDEDYEDTKKRLYPLLRAGNITFDLLWALFQPNDIAITSCYGTWDEPRCFRVEQANRDSAMARGEWYAFEGKYLEYDGKSFGYGDFEIEIESFKGPRKITSLPAYPLRYHRDPDGIRRRLVARGQRFVEMEGMHYKFHKGMAFVKRKKKVLKININGRVMIDPATFRRVNPNYAISYIKPKDVDELFSDSQEECESDDESCCCRGDCASDKGGGGGGGITSAGNEQLEQREILADGDCDAKPKYKYKWTEDERGETVLAAVEVDSDGEPIQQEPANLDHLNKLSDKPQFTEEELLLTSPVVLGFAFSEKLWLEFTLVGVRDIEYNEAAFDSLVLPPNHKSIVRALVESHTRYSARTIDDVVQGKGKGLVAVLHGPPGTGKTLTAEGISELLRCPLYMVAAGELGTDPTRLEHELQKILDIAHSWGAVLLLDEADVFLEKREMHDIHRNALVSTFLRLLEYYQGILFLTTNRVETFDDAFQSRIHVALRYSELTHKARKTVWDMFIGMVRKVEGMEVASMKDSDIEALARHTLNGRQIKNVVRTAQALALNEKVPLTLDHIYRVLDVAEAFDRDLKGGAGYMEAMRSYT